MNARFSKPLSLLEANETYEVLSKPRPSKFS